MPLEVTIDAAAPLHCKLMFEAGLITVSVQMQPLAMVLDVWMAARLKELAAANIHSICNSPALDSISDL